jgi:hypothetical protein
VIFDRGPKGQIVTKHLGGFGVKIFLGLPDATHIKKQIGRIAFLESKEIKKWNQETKSN